MNNTFAPRPFNNYLQLPKRTTPALVKPSTLAKSKEVVRKFSKRVWQGVKGTFEVHLQMDSQDWDQLFEFVWSDMKHERDLLDWQLSVSDPNEDARDSIAKIEIFKGMQKVVFYKK